ncbi:hypothetical protein CAEBREN_26048 [Caenorhabditis brenneri]|uniref:Exocyst complex component Sec3 PIP2-binding N-terminal domain-containing protein n=1 Tax=Caenorhabditis brenneri TaxID=135651 RepID=G0ND66_CAEBE|nr:hypothetical protein CAEBREN_26048 [Caenorhabditis brenneri]
MLAIRKIIQRQFFQKEDERIQAIVNVSKLDGKKKKNQTLLCLAVTNEHPIAVRLYFVKGEKDYMFKKRTDSICARSEKFSKNVNRLYVILAGSTEEKKDFIRELCKLSCQHLPLPEHDIAMQFADLTIGDAHLFAEQLTEQLQSLDGAIINYMIDSENSVNQLLSSTDAALKSVESVEKELDRCDDTLAFVRSSIEVIGEKDSLSAVERKNKQHLNDEVNTFVKFFEAVTDAYIETLKQNVIIFFSSFFLSVQKCTDAAHRNDELSVVDVFVDRLMSHLSAFFSNLNGMSLDHEWHELCIPKQSQRFQAVSPLLINCLKTNHPKVCSLVLQKNISIQRLSELKRSLVKTSDSANTTFPELSAVIDAEQKYVVRSSLINSELSQFDSTSTGSRNSSSLGGRSMEKHMNGQVRHVMGNLLDSLNIHLDSFCRAILICINVVLFFLIMSKKVLLPQVSSSYFSIFEFLIFFQQMECTQLSEVRIAKITRIGVLPSIAPFKSFVRQAENSFENAKQRTDMEKAYFNSCRAFGIESRKLSKRNHVFFSVALSELKIASLDQQRKDAKIQVGHDNEKIRPEDIFYQRNEGISGNDM